jgi:tRNA (guanine37-N1)-methyltransferase
VDQKPYGGGPGMVMEPLATIKAIQKAVGRKKDVKIIFFEADGKQFDNRAAKVYTKKYKHIVMVCGRYEGIDARVRKVFRADSISIGPYVLTGGELPAMIVLDSVARQIEGVLGNFESVEENRISSSEVYTRPEELTFKGKKYRVPEVLLSGHHKKIEEWKGRKKK